MAQVGFRINRDRCIGCRACAVACKAENNTSLGISYRAVVVAEKGTGSTAIRVYTSMACNHCVNPACKAACDATGVSAISKDSNGIVLIDQDTCVGCRKCEAACPYGAPQYNADQNKVEKCTFCEHRFEAGSPYGASPADGMTACAQTCPGKALKAYANITPVLGDQTGEYLPAEDLTNPGLRVIPSSGVSRSTEA